jgi:hypothetical protein
MWRKSRLLGQTLSASVEVHIAIRDAFTFCLSPKATARVPSASNGVNTALDILGSMSCAIHCYHQCLSCSLGGSLSQIATGGTEVIKYAWKKLFKN